MLFTDRSLWTIVHGVVLGGAALMALAAALFAMGVMRVADRSDVATDNQSRSLPRLMVFITGLLHSRWKNRQIESRRVYTVTLVLVGLGMLGTFPPVWGMF
jgi:hypothetical protein